MVDFEWYRSFIAIFKHNSVSVAAKTRMMTQPTMSQHLASLEAEIGELLFTRTTRKLSPTERGKQLFSFLLPHIESLEEKTMELKLRFSPKMKTIKIGTTPELFNDNIMARMSRMDLKTINYFDDADQLPELLSEDRVDIIITTKKFLTPGIEYVRLREAHFVIVVPIDLDVPEFANLKEKEQWLLKQQWISYGLELPIIRWYWKEFFKTSPQITPIHVIPNMHLILGAVGEGLGVSLLPTYMLKEDETTEPKWRTLFEHLNIRSDVLIGFQSKHKHVSVINEFIKNICEPNLM
ncbi:LysR family transcriptional regulator [Paenibacillus glycinis]|uniref:LysR family transcriptional regulator n=1 Tax=Paenibacillus glycinis TaxID=2697035 RepID=A0ABW9XZ48_9BACL|nr:LysR family transcriptional regulator [Paenibacillus glycinis]NBD27997.1 LysR family transcriptional regulator [Paenibacillus glycinis]